MTKLFKILQRLLSGNKVSVLIVLLAIITRVIQLIFFYNIRVDGMYQVIAMQNFTGGHGISLSHVLASDLSITHYEPLINWPPGYSLLLLPFYILFNHDFILAGLTLDILAAITLIMICRRILHLLETPLYLINVYTLLTAFFIYYFYFIASSDAIAITFFMLAVYVTLLMLKKENISSKTISALIISLFLCGFIKYLFMPVVLIIPLFLFVKGHAEKNKGLKKTGIVSFLAVTISFAVLLFYQKYAAGSAAYISEPTRGIFPENLLTAWPAYPASFLKPDTVELLIPGSGQTVFTLFQFAHLLLFGAAFIFLFLQIRKKSFRGLTATDSFFYLAFFLSAGITFLLMILSLRVGKEENYPGHWWTYVEDPRYYGIVNVMLHLAVFLLYTYYRAGRSKTIKYAFIGLLLLMLPETFRGLVFTGRRIIHAKKEEYSWQYERSIQQYADEILKKEKKIHPEETAVVTGSSYYMYHRVGIYSHIPALKEASKINELASLNSSKPAVLLVILQEKDLRDYQPFLSLKEKELAGVFRGFYFYTTHVTPH